MSKSKKPKKSKAKTKSQSLTVRQERFVEEYLVDLNATQAAIRAGYSRRGATVQGSTLLANPKIAEKVQAGRERLSKEAGVSQERVLKELVRIGFSDIRKIFDENGNLMHPQDIDDDTAAAIASIEVVTRPLGEGEIEYVHKIKMSSKLDALEKIAKHLGLYKDPEPAPQTVYNDNRTMIVNNVRDELQEIFGAALGSSDRPNRGH